METLLSLRFSFGVKKWKRQNKNMFQPSLHREIDIKEDSILFVLQIIEFSFPLNPVLPY